MFDSSFVNAIAAVVGIIPAIGFLILAQRNKGQMWRVSTFLLSIICAGFAFLNLMLFSSLELTYQALHSAGKIDTRSLTVLMHSISTWSTFLLAVFMGITFCLLGAYWTSKKAA